jgi:glycosyltransferase involved in cell wall biosynthesis
VHGIYLLPHGLIAVLAARLSARPSVVAIIGTDLHGHLERGSAAWRRLLLAGLRRADRVTATGSRSLRRLAALGVAEGRLCILPNGVEVPPQAAVEPDLDLLFVGRLAEVKRPLHFVELVDRLRRRRGAVRAALLGDGPLRPAVEARLRELGLAGAVDLPGHVADVGRWLARSRLLVLPSRAEGLPYAVVEAMAAGVPPLAAAVGDLPDLVESGCSGLLVEDFDDLETVAAAVAALLDDEPARRRMGAAARQVVRERFSLSACRLVWRDLLEDLAGASAA